MSKEQVYKHDCDECVFLGQFTLNSGKGVVDCYFCGKGDSMSSIIARYGDEGDQYASTLPPQAFANPVSYIQRAEKWYHMAMGRACYLGLFDDETRREIKRLFSESATYKAA